MTQEHLTQNEDELADKSLSEALNLSFKILKGIMLLLVALFLGSGVFIVEQNEVALVTRFGNIVGSKSNRELKSGLHWTFPFPVSKVVKVSKKTQSITITDFWYHEEPNMDMAKQRRSASNTLDPENEGYCLTRDANILHVEKIQVRYTINNAYDYIMNHENPQDLIHNVVLHATITSIASFSVSDARKKTDELISKIKEVAQTRLIRLKSGIEIDSISLRVIPPLKVQDAFESVIEAETRKGKNIAAAEGYEIRIQNEAEAEANEIIKEAQRIKEQIVQEAQSDAHYLNSIAKRFKDTPDIYKEIHYNKALAEISENIQEIFILSGNAQDRELHIQLNRDPELRKQKAPDGQEPDIREKENK